MKLLRALPNKYIRYSDRTTLLSYSTRAKEATCRNFVKLNSSSPMMTLSKFLCDAKKRYLNVVRTGGGRSWAVVMGNEAGGEYCSVYN